MISSPRRGRRPATVSASVRFAASGASPATLSCDEPSSEVRPKRSTTLNTDEIRPSASSTSRVSRIRRSVECGSEVWSLPETTRSVLPYTESNRSVKVRWIVAARTSTPTIIPTPRTIPAAVSKARSLRALTWRKASEPKERITPAPRTAR
jgi:hypothetical protein